LAVFYSISEELVSLEDILLTWLLGCVLFYFRRTCISGRYSGD